MYTNKNKEDSRFLIGKTQTVEQHLKNVKEKTDNLEFNTQWIYFSQK